MKFISDIILLLWRIFDFSDAPLSLVNIFITYWILFLLIYLLNWCSQKQWFVETHASSAINHLIVDRFPYSLNENFADSLSKTNKPKNKVSVPGIPAEHSAFLMDKQCRLLNMSLCHIYLLFCEQSFECDDLKTISRYVTSEWLCDFVSCKKVSFLPNWLIFLFKSGLEFFFFQLLNSRIFKFHFIFTNFFISFSRFQV